MIRLTDPNRIGPALKQVRDMLGLSRRAVARMVAEKTGRSENSCNAQIWGWDVGVDGEQKGGAKPSLDSLKTYLEVLDFDLALVEKIDPDGLRTWPRLEDPPADVVCVKASSNIWNRPDGGTYWYAKGYEEGVTWSQLLRWGPVTEVKEPMV